MTLGATDLRVSSRLAALFAAVFFFGSAFTVTLASSAEKNGSFEGRVVIEQLDDGETFVVRAPLAFIDPLGVKWRVPEGAKTNCASVPQFAWTVFPPCRDRHLRASVIHDHYCETRDRPWEAVHRMFYDALRASGVSSLKAKTMYAAVYQFGPRWDPAGAKVRSAGAALPIDQRKAKLAVIEKWIAQNNPTMNELEKRLSQQAF